ncbi:type IV pilus secretin PilQ [Vibrio rhodolitus]|uniref:type IV pilus secretin PilQ n=1 Tax=Vibrio rhodolitus TaxID=2231649 RepID=UPI000E0A95DD|nr:type IV pilus secretin PilQ [Vibrio rhodolitus]
MKHTFLLRNLWLAVVLLCSLTSHAGTTGNEFVGLDFKLDSERNGHLVIELSNRSIALDVRKKSQGLVIDLPDTTILPSQLSQYDVRDFATNVQTIELREQQGRVQFVVNIEGDYRYHYQIKQHYIEVVIMASASQNSLLTDIDREQRISINFQDIPVRRVLQMLAEYNQLNLVVSDSVTGNLTMRLDEVPWQQVLDILLQAKGLDKYIEGNVMLVAPIDELAQERLRQQQRERDNSQRSRQSQLIKINFANAQDIATLISPTQGGMLSEQGSLQVDERTNTLLIHDFPTNINRVREIVASLDVPIKQVQIEARIVTVSEGTLDELGVRWSINSNDGKLGATLDGNFAQRNQAQLYDYHSGDVADLLNVNLAAAALSSSSIAFQVAKLGGGTLLDLELSALQRESKAEVISSPRLITTNKQAAYIEQGTEIPYLEAASSGATSVSFKKAVLSLKVTPQITPDNRLILDLDVTQDRPGEVLQTGTGEAVSINTQRIGTQVLVENGQTIVLGGIYQHSVTDTVDKVPLLGDLPLLGSLFRRSYQQLGKSELLIFVTPKVVVH